MENLNLSKVRVRIAPSPTGFVHIGTFRTVLYNYLFARHNGGKFIVRIEDTDRTRFVDGAIEDLLRTLQWAGFDYDEGPKLKGDKIVQEGDFGPYIQSERLDLYQKHIKTLIDKNKAYYCFCPKDRLDALREDQKKHNLPPKYDRACRDLDREEVKKRLAAGEEFVIRFKMPEDKEVVFEDVIHGVIKVNTNDLDDFVLIKADGYPTYHFANIIDDHLMKITHVLRGDEWIASTPKHVLLYEAFGWKSPIYAHVPLTLGKDKRKLSKRDGAASVKDFINKGYLKDALLNYIALLGWNSGTEQEIYSMDELIKQFSLDNVHKAGAVFDIDKLDWINGLYVRNLSNEDFAKECLPVIVQAGLIAQKGDKFYNAVNKEEISMAWIVKVCALEKPRIKRLVEMPEVMNNYFTDKLKIDPKILVWKKSDASKTKEVLQALHAELHAIEETDFNLENIQKKVMDYIEKNSLSNGDVMWPLRVALSGRDKSPGPFEIGEVLGKQRTLDRIENAIKKLK
jgi:nondiscriminating glutamyl-tRNA synthetase